MIQIRPVVWLTISGCLLAVLLLLLLLVGTVQIPAGTVAAIIGSKLLPVSGGSYTAVQETIVLTLRWPRVALGILVGAGLGIAGVCFQSLFRNPLADPFVLGVSSGAALGASVAIVLGVAGWIMGFAFSGATVSLAIVWLISQRSLRLHSSQQLLLAGVTCGAFFNALMSSIMAMNSQQMQLIIFWLMGSLNRYEANLSVLAAVIAAGLALAVYFARDLDALALGEEEAAYLGVEVDKVRLVILLTATCLTAVCVCVTGIIGFIGLIVPHLARRLTGAEHRFLLPFSAIWGAIFLLLADGVTRFFLPLAGVPVGVVTALVGGPFFLYVLYAKQEG